MFSMLLEKEPSEEDIPEEEEEAEEEEEVVGPDEETVLINEDIMECFAIFDKNKNGFFENKYLEKALKCLGIFLTKFEMEDLKESMSQNGMVLFETFYTYAFEKLSTGDPYEALKVDFQTFDPDREGTLPNDRFKKWMTTLGDPLSDKEAKELVKLGDPGGKGFIVYGDLVMILLKK